MWSESRKASLGLSTFPTPEVPPVLLPRFTAAPSSQLSTVTPPFPPPFSPTGPTAVIPATKIAGGNGARARGGDGVVCGCDAAEVAAREAERAAGGGSGAGCGRAVAGGVERGCGVEVSVVRRGRSADGIIVLGGLAVVGGRW